MIIVTYLFNIIRFILKRIKHGSNINVKLLERVSINTSIFIHKGGKLLLGKNVGIENYGKIVIGNRALLSIGDKVYMNQNINIGCLERITIGNNCTFGPNVCIYDNDHKVTKDELSNKDYITKSIEIGESTWCGANVIILKGTSIGKHCVIGAGCVVSGKIPDYSKVVQNRELEMSKM